MDSLVVDVSSDPTVSPYFVQVNSDESIVGYCLIHALQTLRYI